MQTLNLGDDTDFSFSEFPPKDGFDYLHWSSSFQASIIQVCSPVQLETILPKLYIHLRTHPEQKLPVSHVINWKEPIAQILTLQLQSAWWACLVATRNSFLMFQLYTRIIAVCLIQADQTLQMVILHILLSEFWKSLWTPVVKH